MGSIGSIWMGDCACAGMCLTQSDVLGGYTVGREPFKINLYGPQVRAQPLRTIALRQSFFVMQALHALCICRPGAWMWCLDVALLARVNGNCIA